MYTLKVQWFRYRHVEGQPSELQDESMVFVPAERVVVFSTVAGDPERSKLINSYAENGAEVHDYLWVHHKESADGKTGETEFASGRLIRLDHGEDNTWYLCTRAWLLNEQGQTIERVAP